MKSKIFKPSILIAFFAVIAATLLFLCLAGCNQNSQQSNSKNDPAIGQWETIWKWTDQPGNKEEPCILTINADGKAYWMSLSKSSTYQITDMCYETWEKVENDIYSITEDDGTNYKFRYDKDSDTMNSLGYGLTYTRLDPIVGIWTGGSSEQSGSGNASTIFKSDGTGLAIITFENGTADITTLTWNKNPENKYEATYSSGINRTYTVSEDGKSLTTDDGRSKIKCFTDSTYLLPIIGAWYSPDKNNSAVFNADGTGFCNADGKIVCKFNWKTSNKDFEITYIDGVDTDGNSVAGKSFKWTYDIENNTIAPPSGTKYIRPTSSIPGLITFK